MRITWSKFGIPHGYVCSTPVHIIYRLKGCLPVGPLRELHNELKEQLAALTSLGETKSAHRDRVLEDFQHKYDEMLDALDQKKYILTKPDVAQIVLDSWEWLENQDLIRRIAICVMGNHIHAVIVGVEGNDEYPLGVLLTQHKTFTNHEIRKKHELPSVVWELGYFDRYVREGSLDAVVLYVVLNPTKAGLIQSWDNWPYLYIAPTRN